MVAQRQKHPDSLMNKRGGRYRPLQMVPAAFRVLPPCPEGVGEEARAIWVALWSSKLAGAYGEIDVLVLGRWLSYWDEWHKAKAHVAKHGPTVKGRRGGDVLNPQVRLMFRLESAMREIEKSCGLDPMTRLRLGVTLAEAYDSARPLKAATAIKEYRDRLGQR